MHMMALGTLILGSMVHQMMLGSPQYEESYMNTTAVLYNNTYVSGIYDYIAKLDVIPASIHTAMADTLAAKNFWADKASEAQVNFTTASVMSEGLKTSIRDNTPYIVETMTLMGSNAIAMAKYLLANGQLNQTTYDAIADRGTRGIA